MAAQVPQVDTNAGNEIMSATNATNQTAELVQLAGASAGGGVAGSFSTMQQLKQEAPDVYEGMIQAIASQICNDSQNSSDRIVALMRENEDPP